MTVGLKLLTSVAVGLVLAMPLYGQGTANIPNAKAILDSIDDLWRGESSKSRLRMVIETEHWQRDLVLQNHSLGKESSLVVIESPAKERGTATLRVGNDIWNYLPKTDREIKLPPSMLLNNWMGSHFTNDDLVKGTRMADDYTFSITFSGKRDGVAVHEITLIPKPSAPVVWGRVVVEVRQEDFMPLVERFYDEKDRLAREANFGQFRQLDGKLLPAEMIIRPADKPRESTKVIILSIDFDIGLTPEFFSLKQLRK